MLVAGAAPEAGTGGSLTAAGLRPLGSGNVVNERTLSVSSSSGNMPAGSFPVLRARKRSVLMPCSSASSRTVECFATRTRLRGLCRSDMWQVQCVQKCLLLSRVPPCPNRPMCAAMSAGRTQSNPTSRSPLFRGAFTPFSPTWFKKVSCSAE